MKKILIAIIMITASVSNSHAEQVQVTRLHVESGSFTMLGLESPIGPFVLEPGTYQGDPLNVVYDHIVSWQFGFFGPVYNYTAATNVGDPTDNGGPVPTGFVDTLSNTIHMDMSSWFAWWNGTHFNQGSAGAVGSFDPVSGYFTLSWQKTITAGPFQGQTGMWHITGFAETGVLSILIPSIQVVGGDIHECNQHGGASVVANLTIQNSANVVISDISWFLDDLPIASNVMQLQHAVPLGSHIIRVDVTAEDGTLRSTSQAINVEDTQAPQLDLSFVDSRSGAAVSVIDSHSVSWIKTNIQATDACDPTPLVSGFGSFAATHGDLLKVQGNNGTIQLTTNSINLRANGSDASGNSASDSTGLLINP